MTAGGKERAPRLTVTAWDRDPEVARFFLTRLGVLSQVEIRRRAVEQFGEERVPSKSAINRLALQQVAREKALVQRRQARLSTGLE